MVLIEFATTMQIACAAGGTLAGLMMWIGKGGILWLLGAVARVFAIPLTIKVLKPINDQLLNPNAGRSEAETEKLLNEWGSRHMIRSIASGLAFVIYLLASLTG